ncbi:MAG: hypothetical protein IKK93_11475 [Campylobacter sp.]|nr:hypothetical protein [Campylobacter sp.]
MAFVNRQTWRCKFIDIDESFVIKTQDESIIGWMACRAPKGNTKATYFPSGNSGAIDALMGVGSANWPDLLEAKAFNAEYPIYISAPPGDSKVYPSYLGGFYLTRNGLYKFYRVKSKDELREATGGAFKVKVVPTQENAFSPDFNNQKTQIEISGPLIPDYIPTSGKPGYGFLTLKRSDSDYAITFTKPSNLNVVAIDYDTMKNGKVAAIGTDTTYWGDEDGLWSFSGNDATLINFGINYTEAQKADTNWNPLKDWIGAEAYSLVMTDTTGEKLASLLLNGICSVSNRNVSIAFGLTGLFAYQVDIEDDVYAYFMQKSPTEIKTTITLKSIGYDKYYYQNILPYAPLDTTKSKETEGKLYVAIPTDASADDIAHITSKIKRSKYLAFYDSSSASSTGYVEPKYVGVLNDANSEDIFYEITDDLSTKVVTFQENIIGGKIDSIFHRIYKINSGNNFTRLNTEEELIEEYGQSEGKAAYEVAIVNGTGAIKNPNFNNIDIVSSEEVYAGKTTSGGEFIGSLDPLGVNSYGNENYLEDLLQDDDASFIEVRVLKKFGDDTGDLDENGFWRGNRVIDPYDVDGDGSAPTQKIFTIEGDRYISLIMEKNLKLGKLGGDWDASYLPIMQEALEEAKMGIYDDAYLFMEPTGREELKDALAAINRAQEMATVISPKILTPNEKGIITEQIANKTIVNGRINEAANAQFAGEFEVKDPVTAKKYWRKPIGSVGKMLARSMDRMYGLVPCAWINEGGLGGQLTDSTAIRARYSFDQDANKALDAKGINPIVMNGEDGIMITSNKTTQDPNFLSDWSWLNNAMSFVVVKREIRNDVMIPQIMKPINPYYIGIRQGQVESICAKRTDMKNNYWHSVEIDIAGVNTKITKQQKLFVIKVVVMVTPISEGVELIIKHKLYEE